MPRSSRRTQGEPASRLTDVHHSGSSGRQDSILHYVAPPYVAPTQLRRPGARTESNRRLVPPSSMFRRMERSNRSLSPPSSEREDIPTVGHSTGVSQATTSQVLIQTIREPILSFNNPPRPQRSNTGGLEVYQIISLFGILFFSYYTIIVYCTLQVLLLPQPQFEHVHLPLPQPLWLPPHFWRWDLLFHTSSELSKPQVRPTLH